VGSDEASRRHGRSLPWPLFIVVVAVYLAR